MNYAPIDNMHNNYMIVMLHAAWIASDVSLSSVGGEVRYSKLIWILKFSISSQFELKGPIPLGAAMLIVYSYYLTAENTNLNILWEHVSTNNKLKCSLLSDASTTQKFFLLSVCHLSSHVQTPINLHRIEHHSKVHLWCIVHSGLSSKGPWVYH